MKLISITSPIAFIRSKIRSFNNLSTEEFGKLLEKAKEGTLATERLADVVGFITTEQEEKICKTFIENYTFISDPYTNKYFSFLIKKSTIFSELILQKCGTCNVRKSSMKILVVWLIKPICELYPDLIKSKVDEHVLPKEYLSLIPTS